MTTIVETPRPATDTKVVDQSRGACVDFVEFCKEQYLTARAAHTFIRVLHNPNWEAECERIRTSMRPEVDRIFAPIEESLDQGTNCREILKQLVDTLAKAEK